MLSRIWIRHQTRSGMQHGSLRVGTPSFILRILTLTTSLLFTYASAGLAASDSTFTLSTKRMTVLFSSSGDILSITPRYHQAGGTVADFTFNGTTAVPLLSVLNSGAISEATRKPEITRTDSVSSIKFTFSTMSCIYTLDSNTCLIDLDIHHQKNEAGISTVHASFPVDTTSLIPIALVKNKQITINTDSSRQNGHLMQVGIRNKFWALLIDRSPDVLDLDKDRLSADYHSSTTPISTFHIYAGPVEYHELVKVNTELTHLLYPLWFWMRWISLGLLHLFTLLLKVTGNVVPAIFLLSIGVKILLAPLYHIAEKWQRSVNQQKSLLAPRLSKIKKTYRGEEQTQKVLALYKELGVSPLYELKSLASAAIQIPVFFSAYHMLSEHIALSGISFLWAEDLSKPDMLLTLPFTLGYFGNSVNLFPFIMTSITILASSIHGDTSLSNDLHHKQRTSLFLMAALFFLLLYPSAAGMLLYWTMNNILALVSSLSTRYLRPLTFKTSGVNRP